MSLFCSPAFPRGRRSRPTLTVPVSCWTVWATSQPWLARRRNKGSCKVARITEWSHVAPLLLLYALFLPYLTISAQKGLDKDDEDKKGRILRQERYAGACSRSFFVGDIKPEDIKAKYESGILTVLVPKESVRKLPTSTSISIE